MTRDQLESVLKTVGAKSEKDGTSAFADGASATIHVSSGGAGQAFTKIDSVKIDGELVICRGAKQTLAIVLSDIFAVSVEGAPGQPARKPPGFG